MLQGEHQFSDFIAVIFVYGIIFSEYYAFVFIFLPAFLIKHGVTSYFIGIEFSIIFIFLNLAYIMIQYIKPGYPPQDLAKHYHERTFGRHQIKNKNDRENQQAQIKKNVKPY